MTTPRAAAVAQAQALLDAGPLYLDTETTGLGPRDEIVEICLLDADGAVLLESLVHPQRPIPTEVMRIHGISNSLTADAPTWRDLWPQIAALIQDRRLAIYNADFDLRLMRQCQALNGLPWPALESRSVCIMRLYAQYRGDWNSARGGFRWYSLQDAGRQCQISLPNNHRARGDALLARAVLHAMTGRAVGDRRATNDSGEGTASLDQPAG